MVLIDETCTSLGKSVKSTLKTARVKSTVQTAQELLQNTADDSSSDSDSDSDSSIDSGVSVTFYASPDDPNINNSESDKTKELEDSETGTAKDSETAECIGRGGCGKSFPCDQVGAEFTYSKLCKSCYQQKCKTVFYMLL
jgi:hypothetical protein